MTDRQLLESAAKAAGHAIYTARQAERDAAGHGGVGLWLASGHTCWNPLTSDSDALRLAVRLRLNLNFEEWDGAEYACAVPHKSHQGQDEVIGDDENAAARRAIVRAAAAMPAAPAVGAA